MSPTISARTIATQPLGVTVAVELRYDAAAPFEVRLVFFPDAPQPEQVSWVMARDLLADGMRDLTGVAGVWVGPCGPDGLLVYLRSPDGTDVLVLDRAVVALFLVGAYELVPRGSEQLQGMDAWLAEVLKAGPR